LATYCLRVEQLQAQVTVEAVNDELPQLIHNSAATVEFGGTVTLTDNQLKATDVDNPHSQIHYVLLSRPTRGALQRMTSNRHHPKLGPSTSKAVWIQVRTTSCLKLSNKLVGDLAGELPFRD